MAQTEKKRMLRAFEVSARHELVSLERALRVLDAYYSETRADCSDHYLKTETQIALDETIDAVNRLHTLIGILDGTKR